MSSKGQKILVVEGQSDKRFFESLFEYLSLKDAITIAAPKENASGKVGKPAAIELLNTLMRGLSQKEGITHLAMVVDADYIQYGGGYQKTLQEVQNVIKKHQYGRLDDQSPGLSFEHSNGFRPFGLWIMPNNQDDGVFENWVKESIKEVGKYPLLEHATSIVKGLPEIRFKHIQYTKAEVATWMAWQEKPGEGLHKIISRNLIDVRSEPFTRLVKWIERIYNN